MAEDAPLSGGALYLTEIMYYPLTDKKPYGATAVGKKTTVRFPLPPDLGAERVFIVLRKDKDIKRIELPFKNISGGEAVFEGSFALEAHGIWHYRFEGELSDGGIAFFGRDLDGRAVRGDWLPEWQLTVSKMAYKTPDWAKQGIIYHIFADRFAKAGEIVFDKKGTLHTDWNEKPQVAAEGVDYRADDFFGGNIEGIISKLDYLKSLGVTCIYLSPIFESGSNHRYDTGDYMKIDPLFGDEPRFKRLLGEAEKMGIKVMLDGVFNHTGADSIYFNKFGNYPLLGAYQSEQSPYRDWYTFSQFPDTYDCWWGSTVVPTVNKSAEGYRKLMLGKDGVIDKWTKLGVKGWRLDVVDELPIDFTDMLCASIKKSDKDALIIGEVWEDASIKVSYSEWRPYFMGNQLDGVMNYPFKEAIIAFVLEGDIAAFKSAVTTILENYPKESLDVAMTLLGTHDTVRALTKLSGAQPPFTVKERSEYRLSDWQYALAKHRLKAAAALQFTLPGVPCVYYGDEAGVQGFEDPMNRATYPWGNEDKELISHYKSLGEMRTRYADILRGETVFTDDPELLVYDRIDAKGKKRLRVLSNPHGSDKTRSMNCTDALTGERVEKFVIPAGEVKIVILS